MTTQSSLAAVDNLKRALFAAVDRYRRMSKVEFVQTLVDLCEPLAPPADTTMQEAMSELAAAGSIEAVAALVVMGSPDNVVLPAMTALSRRSEDVRDGLIIEELTRMAEEFFDEEVAAGRMVAAVDPATGKKVYSSKGPGYEPTR